MQIHIARIQPDIGRHAAAAGAVLIRSAIEHRGCATIVATTGASQDHMLDQLAREPGIDWARVVAFQFAEYVGIRMNHPGSLRRELEDRLLRRLPGPIGRIHCVIGEADPDEECARIAALVASVTIDVAFIGLEECGYLASTGGCRDLGVPRPYRLVSLDAACRSRKLNERRFATLEEVPERAISLSIDWIMRASSIICTAPDGRKARTSKPSAVDPTTPFLPVSIIQRHPRCAMFLDDRAAALLTRVPRNSPVGDWAAVEGA